MQVNLGDKPPTQWFFEDKDKFGLKLKRFTGTDRMAVFDAVATNEFEQIEQMVQRLIVGWEEVKDESGRVIPFETERTNGQKVCNLDAFMGAIGVAQQLEVTLGIVAFLGLPKQLLRTTLENLKRVLSEEPDLDPTSEPAGDTPASASTGSST